MEPDLDKPMISGKEPNSIVPPDEGLNVEAKNALNSVDPKSENVGMKKTVGLPSAVALIVGTMIGKSVLFLQKINCEKYYCIFVLEKNGNKIFRGCIFYEIYWCFGFYNHLQGNVIVVSSENNFNVLFFHLKH